MILKNLHIELRQMLDRISSICSLSGLADILEYCIIGQSELEEPLKIAIVGITSSGKSTLLNVLVKRSIVPTGAETLTYNVNILRHVSRSPHGKEEIVAHLKNGETQILPISSLTGLVDGRDRSNAEIQDNISWVEAYVDFDYLKDIDLIDTPGLLSTKEKDSNNTLELFKNEMRKPDVFIYLMQRAVQNVDIEAVTMFQGALSNGSNTKVNGLNTIGALTHCDYLCQGDFSKNLHKLGQRLVENNRELYSRFRLCFSKFFTLAAIYAQAAYEMREKDFEILRSLCDSLYDPLMDDLYSKNDFIEDSSVFGRFIALKEDRASFVHRLDLAAIKYAIWWIKQHPDTCYEGLRERLIAYSGVREMDEYVFSNFKRLAVYFKASQLVTGIRKSIESSQTRFVDEDKMAAMQDVLKLCRNFEVELQKSFSFLSILIDYYNHADYFTPEEWEQAFLTIEECLSDAPNRDKLVGARAFWQNHLEFYVIVSAIEAQESCRKLIHQIDLSL